ncbi:MAG: rhodanese-like domain-containing protein [Ignavibacterium sp.]
MNKKNLSAIILVSFFVGFVFNFLNPNGISLIREERVLEFADDDTSTMRNENEDSSAELSDTTFNNLSVSSPNYSENQPETLNPQAPEFKKPLAIKIDKAYQLYKQGVKFIDARMPDEFIEGHIKGALNIPFDGDESYRDILRNIKKDEILVTYCSGTECDLSILLGDELFERGYKKVYIFFGGWNDWLEKGYPVSKGEQ